MVSKNPNSSVQFQCLKDINSSVQLKQFYDQLMTEQVYISACGVARIDRQMMTSVSKKMMTVLLLFNFYIYLRYL